MNVKRAALSMMAANLLLGSSLTWAQGEHHSESAPAQQHAPSASSSAEQRVPNPGSGMAMPDMSMPGQDQSPASPMGQQRMGAMAQPPVGQGAMPMAAMVIQCLAAMGMSEMSEFAETFPGTVLTQRVAGRIAFLRAELNIDDSQAAAWADFAQALRNNAKTLGETQANAVKRQASANAPLTLSERLAAQEEWFVTRAAGIGGVRQGLESLYAVLSDTQKLTADELLPAHLGVGSRCSPMGMMSTGGPPKPGAGNGTH